ncbi:MAG: 5'-methylthioadenosine/adenosylhomocysteine nucleosidase [Clostridium sp.]|nr:5'-methylthioadenosine/adenosylhomocysteine nucleosidase [Clostridium sp.]
MEFPKTDIAIVVAMEKELALLLPLIENRAETTTSGITIHYGTIAGRRVAAMKCGIGKVNAALRAQRLIDTFSPAAVINTGVAGGTGAGAGVLDIVVAERVTYHDVWCGPGTLPGEAAGCPLFFEADPALLETARRELAADPKVRFGLICSGDIFVSRADEVTRIRSLFPGAMAVDMESGALAQTCFLNSVPFLCARVVSDTPGAADNISQYESFWEDAPRHTFECVRTLVENFPLK